MKLRKIKIKSYSHLLKFLTSVFKRRGKRKRELGEGRNSMS